MSVSLIFQLNILAYIQPRVLKKPRSVLFHEVHNEIKLSHCVILCGGVLAVHHS